MRYVTNINESRYTLQHSVTHCNILQHTATHRASLWTRDHLEKRLLEPLGGLSLSISPDLSLATLHFDGSLTLPHTPAHSLALSLFLSLLYTRFLAHTRALSRSFRLSLFRLLSPPIFSVRSFLMELLLTPIHTPRHTHAHSLAPSLTLALSLCFFSAAAHHFDGSLTLAHTHARTHMLARSLFLSLLLSRSASPPISPWQHSILKRLLLSHTPFLTNTCSLVHSLILALSQSLTFSLSHSFSLSGCLSLRMSP